MPVAEQSAPASSATNSVAPPTSAPFRTFLMINSFETGGTERQFVTVAKSLNQKRFQVEIGCLQTKGPLRDLVGEAHKFDLGGSLYGWRSWHSRLGLANHLRRQDIQIAHAFDFYTNLTMIPAARWANVPVVIGSQRQLGDLLTPRQFSIQKLFFKHCDVVVCNSRAAASRLTDDGFPAEKIRVIGNALAPEFFEVSAPCLDPRPGVLRVGMIARMNAHYKNHRLFLQAAAKMARSHPNAEFVLVGDGPLRQEFEAECRALGIGERVRFLGDVRDIPSVLASLDISVVASESESLSNAILESMAAGVPVIATRVGGNPELVNEGRGILVSSGDVDGLANAMSQLLENAALRESLSLTAKAFASENFSVENVTARYEALYSETLQRKLRRLPIQKAHSRKRLRIAVVAPSLRYVGGQAVQADLLLQQWRDDPEVRTTFVPVDPRFPAGLRWVANIPVLRTLVRAPFYWASLWRGLRDADVVHLFSASYSSFLVAPFPAWLVAKMRGKKTLINYHSGEARDHLRHSRLARAVLRHVDRVIAPGGYLVDVFQEFALCAQSIPNTVDTTQFRFRERVPLRPYLVCTRGFHPYYCIDVVVRAFAEIKKQFPTAQLDLVGGGPLEPQIRTLVSDLNLAGVNFCGVAARNEIAECYDRADIFINASQLDNMPVSVLEAFASGTPVVTTAPESMRYLVEHERTGLLSKPGDAEALTSNVVRLLRDSDLAQRLISNALLESRKYEWSNVREKWLQVYRELGNVELPVNEFDRAIRSNGASD